MALEALTAKANTGTGTDLLAGETIDGKFVGTVRTSDGAGNGSEIATETTLAELNAKAATELTAEAVTELLQEVCIRLADIADSVGNLMPDTAGRIRVAAETLGTLSTITTVTTVTTVTNMANQTNIGGFAANQHMMALTQMAEQALRQNIVIS